MKPDEAAFESAICDWLTSRGGYDQVKVGIEQDDPADFDPVGALDTAELFAFIGATQPDEWAELVKRHGNDPNVAQSKFADRLAGEIDKSGRSMFFVTVSSTMGSRSGWRSSSQHMG